MTKVKELFYVLAQSKSNPTAQWRIALSFIGLLLSFLIVLKVLILSFKLLNTEVVAQILAASSNPFLCLFIGLLSTALLHSSSTITAMTIAIVASGAVFPTSAVYMIMGANIGTTVTATIVALGHATRKKEFRKAISASMSHHLFNVFSVIIFFPLEYSTGFLSHISQITASWFTQNITVNVGSIFSPVEDLLVPIASWILYLLGSQALLGIALAVFLLFYILRGTTQLFQKVWQNIHESPLQIYLFYSPMQALVMGTVITALLQSSTVVTSLIVPVVAANKVSIKRVFPFILGANLGTTFKAIIVGSSAANEAAMSVAFMHFYFNLFGILLFFPLPAIRKIPVTLARRAGKITLKSRFWGFGYIVLIFFLLPFLMLYFSQQPVHIRQYAWTQEKNKLLFYKQTRTLEAESLPALPTAIYLRKKGENIFFEEDMFRLNPPKPCYESLASTSAKSTICLEEKFNAYPLGYLAKKDKCYKFSKRLVGKDNGYVYYYYFSAKEGLLIKREIALPTGKIIFYEELVNIMSK